MPTTSKLAELFRAIGINDSSRATAIAAQIIDLEEKKGHRSASRLLRNALSDFRRGVRDNRTARSPDVPVATVDVMSSALVRLKSTHGLAEIELSKHARSELDAIALEWTHAGKLTSAGISPRSKLLFHGPPGCGKSVSALALADKLGLPAYMVRFDAVIGAFLGQTAIHLRQIFHFAETTPCLLLLDELDALGKKRGSPLDVGELDRIVISLLQELEHSRPLGVIVGTTNLAAHLDRALWRRFDLELEFKKPTTVTLRKFVLRLAEKRKLTLPVSLISRAMHAPSFAVAEQFVVGEARRQILRKIGAR